MTKPKVVFSPVSQEYFENPYEVYKRMRDDAPLYYDEEEDFYALTRHEDVAAAFKDHEAFSSARGCDLGMVRSGEVPQKSIIFMDPPDHRHMRSLLNKVFTPRAIQAQTQNVIDTVEKYLSRLDPNGFDAVQEFTAPFPVEVITTMLGVPEAILGAHGAVSRPTAEAMAQGALERAGVGIEHGLDEAFHLTQRNRLAIANERKAADADVYFLFLGSLFGETDRCDLRRAVGAAGDH